MKQKCLYILQKYHDLCRESCFGPKELGVHKDDLLNKYNELKEKVEEQIGKKNIKAKRKLIDNLTEFHSEMEIFRRLSTGCYIQRMRFRKECVTTSDSGHDRAIEYTNTECIAFYIDLMSKISDLLAKLKKNNTKIEKSDEAKEDHEYDELEMTEEQQKLYEHMLKEDKDIYIDPLSESQDVSTFRSFVINELGSKTVDSKYNVYVFDDEKELLDPAQKKGFTFKFNIVHNNKIIETQFVSFDFYPDVKRIFLEDLIDPLRETFELHGYRYTSRFFGVFYGTFVGINRYKIVSMVPERDGWFNAWYTYSTTENTSNTNAKKILNGGRILPHAENSEGSLHKFIEDIKTKGVVRQYALKGTVMDFYIEVEKESKLKSKPKRK
jgi:hypothetical protein